MTYESVNFRSSDASGMGIQHEQHGPHIDLVDAWKSVRDINQLSRDRTEPEAIYFAAAGPSDQCPQPKNPDKSPAPVASDQYPSKRPPRGPDGCPAPVNPPAEKSPPTLPTTTG